MILFLHLKRVLFERNANIYIYIYIYIQFYDMYSG